MPALRDKGGAERAPPVVRLRAQAMGVPRQMPGHAVPQVPQTGTPYAYPVEDNHRTAHAGRSLCHKHHEQIIKIKKRI